MKIKSLFSALLSAAALTLTLAPPAQAAPVTGQGTWQTTLQARDLDGNGITDAFYDTTLNITWLRNAAVNNVMTWAAANTWAAGYSIGGYNDWRLPTMVDTFTSPVTVADGCNYSIIGGTDCGFRVDTATSEMASLFFNTLGNKSYYDTSFSHQAGDGLTNTGDFEHLFSESYWSGLEYAPSPNDAWAFDIGGGGQYYASKVSGSGYGFFAMAVRPGDVLAATVPEPESLVLALTALAGLGLIRRRALGTSETPVNSRWSMPATAALRVPKFLRA
jgi:MYXO-CTERM domain-containing protein